MKKLLLLLIIGFFIFPSSSTVPLRILFVGNSLTSYNDLPGMFEKFAQEGGKNVSVDQAIFPGQALRHYAYSSELKNKINSNNWDIVVLQSDDIAAFPDMYEIEINTLKKIEGIVYENNPNTQIIYEMIWGIKGGVNIQGEGYYSYQEYFEKIYTGTLHFADEMDYKIAPVGKAWNTSIFEQDSIEFFHADRAHPALPGSYLGACVFYATIFQEEIKDFNYAGDLDKDDAIYLQKVASETVMKSLSTWNLVTTNEPVLKKQNSTQVLVYPNPVCDFLHFRFKQKKPDTAVVNIFNVKGQCIHTINYKANNIGEQIIKWNCRTANGSKVNPGHYFYQFVTGQISECGKFSVGL